MEALTTSRYQRGRRILCQISTHSHTRFSEIRTAALTRGAALAPGDALRWESSGNQQGSVGRTDFDNGCAGKGTCGLPYSGYGIGGGWIVCFA